MFHSPYNKLAGFAVGLSVGESVGLLVGFVEGPLHGIIFVLLPSPQLPIFVSHVFTFDFQSSPVVLFLEPDYEHPGFTVHPGNVHPGLVSPAPPTT